MPGWCYLANLFNSTIIELCDDIICVSQKFKGCQWCEGRLNLTLIFYFCRQPTDSEPITTTVSNCRRDSTWLLEMKGVFPRKKNEAMAILAECPIRYRKLFGAQKQAKTEEYGGNNGGYCLFSKIKKGLENVLSPLFYYGSGDRI
jgi:hypothetical protein